MDDYVSMNKAAWEEAFAVSVNGFGEHDAERLATEETPFLDAPVAAALRAMNLAGKEIGHFCCNNGRELLNAVKLTGAGGGVGFDIAENILAQARDNARKAGLPCTFVQGDVMVTSAAYRERFDCVLVLVGGLCWMEDAGAFFRRAADALRPGGRLLVYEIHPVSDMLAVPEDACFDPQEPKKLAYSYFKSEPFVDNYGMGYVAGKAYESKPFVSFNHTLGEIVTGVAAAGLTLESLAEYDYDVSGNFGELSGQGLPLTYLLVARKERFVAE